jgi:hypothetical protein
MISPFRLFTDHLCPALGTDAVNTALTNTMRFSMNALGVGANTIATRSRAGFVATPTATSSSLTSSALTASTAKDSVNHKFYTPILVGVMHGNQD